MEKEMKIENCTKENDHLKKKIDKMIHENSESIVEVNSIRLNYAELSKEYQKILTRNEEISIEMINLINAKVRLEYFKI